MVRGEQDILPALRGPVLRRRHLGGSRLPGVEPPCGLPRGELDGFLVDVGVGGTLADGLERTDRAAELLALLHVRRREVERGRRCTRHGDGHRRLRVLEDPSDAFRTGELRRRCVTHHQASHRCAEHGVFAFDGHARTRRVDQVEAVCRRHDDAFRDQTGRHAHLFAGELAVGRCRRRRGRRVAHRFGERGGDDAGSGGDAVQRVERVVLHQRGHREAHHRERGDRRGGPTDLLEHDARLEEAEPGATGRLGDRDAHDPGVGERGPEVRVVAIVVGDDALDPLERGRVGQDLRRELAEVLLVGSEREIHQRSALGRPSVNWEIRSRCISLTPPPKVRMIEPRVPCCRRERSTAPGASGSR